MSERRKDGPKPRDPSPPVDLAGWIDRHSLELQAFVRFKMGSKLRARESTADIVQSTFRRILQYGERRDLRDEEHLKRLVYRYAERTIADHARYQGAKKRSVEREASGALHGDAEHDRDLLDCVRSFYTPSRIASARDEFEHLARTMERLPPSHRDVILLRCVQGLPHAEVAKRLRRTPAATRKLLSLARARLSTLLDDPAASPAG